MFPRNLKWSADPASRELLRERLDANGARLSSREVTVLLLRAGLADETFHSFEAVGRRLGISGERVRQIQKHALDLLLTPPDLGPPPAGQAPPPGLPHALPAAEYDGAVLVLDDEAAALQAAGVLDYMDHLVAHSDIGDADLAYREAARGFLLEQFARTGDRLRQLRASWLAPIESAETRGAYSRDLNQFLDYCVEHDLDPLAVRIQEFNLFTTWLRMQVTRYGKPYAVSSRARKIAAISSFYDHLVDVDAVDRNPVTRKARPKFARRRQDKALTVDETDALLDDCSTGHRTLGPLCAALIVEFLFAMGLRVSEVCNLDLDQLSWAERDGVRVRTITFIGKGNREHVRAIPADMDAKFLTPYLAERPIPARLEDGPALLLTLAGKRVNRHQVNRLLQRSSQRGGLERTATPHFGRHTFNRRADEEGFSLEQRQRALGHASSVTTQGYSEVVNTVFDDPSHAVAARLHDTRFDTDNYAEGA